MGGDGVGGATVTYRSRKLLDLCHDTPCMADFPHQCSGTTVPAHSNDLMFGRGASFKADDCFVAALCPDAHDYVDGRKGGWAKDEKRAAWLRAYVKTQRWQWTNGKLEVA